MTEHEHDSSAEKTSAERRTRAREFLRRPAVRIGIVAALVLGAIALTVFLVRAHRFESTDDAFVDARIVRLSPQIAGRVVRVYANDNELVRAGQLLVQIDAGEVQARLDEALSQEALARTELEQART